MTATKINMATIRRRYEPGEGRHWFDADTMRYFHTRLPDHGWEGPGGTYFASSEQREPYAYRDIRGELQPATPRRYSVRKLAGPGKIDTIGEFHSYGTLAQADGAAKRFAAGGSDRRRHPSGRGERRVHSTAASRSAAARKGWATRRRRER
jgi:hypothetical protein